MMFDNPGIGLVIAPVQAVSWCEARVLDGNRLFVVPPGIPIYRAAMLHDFAEIQRTDWKVLNVSSSGVGRAVVAPPGEWLADETVRCCFGWGVPHGLIHPESQGFWRDAVQN